jgi:Cdc6-like AAA superfamily ATPase
VGPVRPPSRSSSPNGLGRRSAAFEATFVNGWRNYTQFRTLYHILDGPGAAIDDHRQSTPHDDLIDRLQQHDGPRTVVILDEVDQVG